MKFIFFLAALFFSFSTFAQIEKFVEANKSGLRSYDGTVIIEPLYDDLYIFEYEIRNNIYNSFFYDFIMTKLNNKWGFIDYKGNVKIPLEFDNIMVSDYDLNQACAVKNGKYGVIDNKGNVIIPFIYSYLYEVDFGFYFAQKDDKWGIINENEKIILPFEFEKLKSPNSFSFRDSYGLSMFQIDGKWGLINAIGRKITPCKYDTIDMFTENDAYWSEIAPVRIGEKWGYLDIYGNEKNIFYDSTFYCIDSFCHVYLNGKYFFYHASGLEIDRWVNPEYWTWEDLYAVKKNQKWGVINRNGQFIVTPEFDTVVIEKDYTMTAKSNGKWFFVDKAGSIISFEYDSIATFFDDFAAVRISDKWAFVNKSGKEISPFFDEVRLFQEGLAAVRIKDKWSFIDSSGKKITKDYEQVDDFKNGFAQVRLGKQFLYLDTKGNELKIPSDMQIWNIKSNRLVKVYKTDYIQVQNNSWEKLENYNGSMDSTEVVILPDKYAKVERSGNIMYVSDYDGKKGVFSSSTKSIIPVKYDDIFFNGIYILKSNNKWGIFDKNGIELKPFIYEDEGSDYIVPRKFNLFALNLNGFWGVVDTNGNELIPFKFSKIEALEGENINGNYIYDYLLTEINNKVGCYDLKGKEIIPVNYDQILAFSKGFFVLKGKKWGIIDFNGKEIIPCIYQKIKNFNEGYILFLNGYCNIADLSGRLSSSSKYNYVSEFKEGLASAQIKGKWGFINLKAEEVIPCKYDYVLNFEKEKAEVVLDGRFFYINKNGVEIK